MKTKVTKTFSELIANRYGRSGESDDSNSVRAARLVANYYGVTPRDTDGGHSTQTSVVFSLRSDDGETLVQRPSVSRARGYSGAQAIADGVFEEYVVDDGAAVSKANSIDTQGSEVSPSEEYLVDVREPLPAAMVPVSRSATHTAMTRAPARPAPRPTEETSKAEATGDDFVADMQQILSGQKVFDPVSKRTVDKGQIGRPPPASPPSGRDAPVAPDKTNGSQAIFDRIAQSMQYANAYDVGTVELENRFTDFDRLSDLPKKGAEVKKSKPSPAPAAAPSSSDAIADSTDFMQDLDAMRRQNAAPSQSFSRAASARAPYSRPFYDTGEHVLTGGDLYPDVLRVGANPGVKFSYGQIISMADLYESVDQLMDTSVSELTKVKALIERSTSFYKSNKSNKALDVSDDDWGDAIGSRYLKLAADNYEHFSPNYLFKDAAFAKGADKHGTNKSAWESYHRRAIEEAQKILLAEKNSSSFLEWPLIINAFGDHFLTDAFAAGHLINKEVMIADFRAQFFSGSSLTSDGEDFFEAVAKLAFVGDVASKFSKLETANYPVCKWGWCFMWHPDIDSPNMFRKLLIQAANQEPERVANFAVKALHDRLNDDGVEVTNGAGDGTWTLTGDGTMNAKNLGIIRKAVQQSVDNINDPSILASNLNWGAFFDKVWKHTPQPTKAGANKIVSLAKEYTSPRSTVLQQAAAKIIGKQVNSLIKMLIDENKLKRA